MIDLEAMVLEQADEITRLRADLAAAKSALFKSANALDWCARGGRMASPGLRSYPAEWAREARETFDALRSADATAALEARDERVRAEERAKVIEEAIRLGDTVEYSDRPDWANSGSWVHCAGVFKMRLDALHTEASREVK